VSPVRKGLVGRRIAKISSSRSFITWTTHSMSKDVAVLISAGRRPGTSAPVRLPISAISSESVETTTAVKMPASWAPAIE
jgi:hypothetical protein